MTNVIEFPKGELTPEERENLKDFIQQELKDFQDTDCHAPGEIQEEILILFEYFRKFMDVLEEPDTKINPDLDFGLFLLQGRIQKIRGMIKYLFKEDQR